MSPSESPSGDDPRRLQGEEPFRHPEIRAGPAFPSVVRGVGRVHGVQIEHGEIIDMTDAGIAIMSLQDPDVIKRRADRAAELSPLRASFRQ